MILEYNNGQGSFLYNHNIREVDVVGDDMGVMSITEDPTKATGKAFCFDSVRVEYPRTADNIFATLLTAKYPQLTEAKLLNEYNSAVLKLIPLTNKKPYENFLADRLAIRTMIDTDCEAQNIPID